MTREKYLTQLRHCRERSSWRIDQRTDYSDYLTWKRQIREALQHLFGRASITLESFDALAADVEKDALASQWKLNAINALLDEQLEDLTVNSTTSSLDNAAYQANVVVVCALDDPELSAVRNIGAWEELPAESQDPHTYYTTEWSSSKGTPIRLVAAASNHMGLTAAGVLAAKMVWRFRPRLVVMVGIAAGVSTKTQGYGDIVAPQVTYDSGSSKTRAVKATIQTSPSPHPLTLEPRVLTRLRTWSTRSVELAAIAAAWPADKPRTNLKLHIGPMYSSPTVLDAKQPIKDEQAHWRKLVGIEMEAHAVHRAATDTLAPPRQFLCFKSICDFAQNKNDRWQRYAAFTAAQFFHTFLLEEWDALSS